MEPQVKQEVDREVERILAQCKDHPTAASVAHVAERLMVRTLRLAGGLVLGIAALWLFGNLSEHFSKPIAALTLGDLVSIVCVGWLLRRRLRRSELRVWRRAGFARGAPTPGRRVCTLHLGLPCHSWAPPEREAYFAATHPMMC